MAKVTYTPVQGEPDETTQFGYHFEKGKSVNVTDEKHLAKFAGNPYFTVARADHDHTLKDHEGIVKQAGVDEAERVRAQAAEATAAAEEEARRRSGAAQPVKKG